MSPIVRRAGHRLATLLLASLVAATSAPAAHAAGLWSTYLKMESCNDLLPLRDTVWIATGEAGILHYQRSTNTWGSITREPGQLASNTVDAITFDRTRNLFAACPGKGVSRRDRDEHWSLINSFDGLPSDTALVLRAFGDTVWIGTTRGLAVWDGTAIAGSVPDLGTPSPFSNNNITGIAITGDTLFVSEPEAIYMARLSERLGTWTRISNTLPLVNVSIRGMATDGRSLMVLALGGNPSNPQQTIFTSFRWNPATSSWPVEVPNGAFSVRRLRDEHGIIVATTTVGTHIRNSENNWTQVAGLIATNNADNFGLEPGVDPNGVVFQSWNGQLVRGGASPLTVVPPGPVGNTARNILWTPDGSVYVSYAGFGISRLRDGAWFNSPSRLCTTRCDTTFGLPAFPAGMVYDPRTDSKWIGNWAGPLTKFQDPRAQVPSFLNIPLTTWSSDPDSAHLHSCVHAMACDTVSVSRGGGVWVGLDSDRIGSTPGDPLGLDLYDTNGNYIRNFGTSYPGLRNGLIRGLDQDKYGNMWIGYKGSSSAGLSTFVPQGVSSDITITDVGGTSLMDVFGIAAHGDSVWVLATDYVHRFRPLSKTLATRLSIAGPPALAGMHPIAVAPNGTVFVGTTQGLRVHRSGVAPVDYTPDNSPLADFEVRAVYCEPSGAVWIATAGGVNRFDPDFQPPPAPKLSSLQVKLYPNPAWLTGAGLALKLSGQATSYTGEVFDLRGRIVHRFSVGGNDRVFWDGRDLQQRPVDPGVYFVRVRGGGAEATSRVVVFR